MAREDIIKLLKDKSLSMADIAKLSGVSEPRVSQIYSKHKTILPLRETGKNIKPRKRNKRLYAYTCKNCGGKFLSPKDNRVYCSYRCFRESRHNGKEIRWPKEMIIMSGLVAKAKELGVTYRFLKRKLIKDYGWTEQTFRENDARRKP